MRRIEFILGVVLIVGFFAFGGWQSVSEYREQERIRQELKWADKEMFRLAEDIADLRARVEKLEAVK